MFAFAAWDRRDRQLVLARDRLGKKPLYYGWQDARFFFGSELKALHAHPDFRPRIDRAALAHLVQYSYVPSPSSIFQGVHKLEAGSLLRVDPSQPRAPLRPQCFWSAREVAERGAAAPRTGTAEEAERRLDALLLDAVGRRMVSDVPLGALLSGGIDSSTVVALMQAQSDRPVRTFAIGFEEAAYDEADHARAVAQHLGTDHTELTVTPEEARGVIPLLPSLYDEPFADTSQIPTFLVSRMAREHVTVALSGDGGDELFAGYERYARCLARWRGLGWLPGGLRAGLGRALVAAGRLGSRGAAVARLGALDRVAESFEASDVRDLFLRMNARCRDVSALVLDAGVASSPVTDPSRRADLSHPLDWMMFVDLAGHLCDDILVKVDRASMGVGLEVRSPLLDHRVVEFAWRLPRAWKLGDGERKWLLRRVLERYVPRALYDRPKMGFGVPLGDWLRGPLRPWAEDLLAERKLREGGYLRPQAVREVWAQHLAGWRDRRFLLWNLLCFQAWLDGGMGTQPGSW
jgi:asparagine synthase (glutamine-hydrolysing)